MVMRRTIGTGPGLLSKGRNIGVANVLPALTITAAMAITWAAGVATITAPTWSATPDSVVYTATIDGSPVTVTGLTFPAPAGLAAQALVVSAVATKAGYTNGAASANYTLLAVPSIFGPADWALVDSPSLTADKLTLTIATLPSNGGSAITALQYKVGVGAWQTLPGLITGAYQITVPAGALASVVVRAANAMAADPANASAAKTATPTSSATAPAAFSVGQWTLADSPSAGGDKLLLTISALPSDGGSAITALQYRRNSGAWSSLTGTGTGAQLITVLSGAAAGIQIRAVNAVNADPANASDTKTVTPTVAAGEVAPALVGTLADMTVNVAATGTISIPVAQAFSGTNLRLFTSTPIHGVDRTIISGGNLILNASQMVRGEHPVIIWAENSLGAVEQAPFTLTVNEPLSLTKWEMGTLDAVGQGRFDTAKLAGGAIANGTYTGAWGSITVAAGFATPAAVMVAGSYTVAGKPLVVRAGERFVSNKTELEAALTGSNSGKMIRLRGNAASGNPGIIYNYCDVNGAPQLSAVMDKFAGLAARCTIRDADVLDRPTIDTYAIFGNAAPANVTIEGLAFIQKPPRVSKHATSMADSGKRFLQVQDGATGVIITGNQFNGHHPIGRLTWQRPLYGLSIAILDSIGTIVENNQMAWVYNPITVGIGAQGTKFRYNDACGVFNDNWFAQSSDLGGNNMAYEAIGNKTRCFIGDGGYHMDAGGHIAPDAQNANATGIRIQYNIASPGIEGVLSPPWPTIVGMPSSPTIQTAANYTAPVATTRFRAEMTPGVATLTLQLASMTGVGTVWTPSTAYSVGQFIRTGGLLYECTAVHTSSATFNVDFASWLQVVDGVQKVGRTGKVTVLPPAGKQLILNGASIASFDVTALNAYYRIIPDSTNDSYVLVPQTQTLQGSFTNNPGERFAAPKLGRFVDARVEFNGIQSTTKSFDWRAADSSKFRCNMVLPAYPGNLDGSGPNTISQSIDIDDDYSAFISGTGNSFAGNITGGVSINGAAALTNDTTNMALWVLSADRSLSKITAQYAAEANPLRWIWQTSLDFFDHARPLAGSKAAMSGMGPGLAPVGREADDKVNFGQFPGESIGIRNTLPWYATNMAVAPVGGGFTMSYEPPVYLDDGAILEYQVGYAVNGGAVTTLTNGTALSYTNTALAVGNVVVAQVRARNANGWGPWNVAGNVTVTQALPATITPTLLAATYLNGVAANSKTFSTTTAGGTSPILVTIGFRTSGAAGVLHSVTGTLDGVAMTVLSSQNLTGNFQIVRLWASAPAAGLHTIVLNDATANFNGISVRVQQLAGAKATQAGAAVGTPLYVASGTSRAPAIVTTASGSWVDYVALAALTFKADGSGVSNAVSDVAGIVNAGNTVTWVAHGHEIVALPGSADATFTTDAATSIFASALEILAA